MEPVLLQPGDKQHYVANRAAYARLPVAGGNTRTRGHFVEHVPRLSRQDFASLVLGSMPADEYAYDDMVDRVVMPGARKQFKETRKVFKKARDDGLHEYTVVPHVPGVDYQPIEDYPDDRSSAPRPTDEKKTYTLHQFFFDTYVIDKFKLSQRTAQTAKRLAISSPSESARFVQQAIRRDGFKHCVVVAGDYSRSKSRCVSSLWDVTRDFVGVEAAIPATIIGKRMVLHDPYDEANGWHVIGPVKYAPELRSLHNMICVRGTSEPMFLLGMELTILEIDIWNGKKYESPTIIDHVAPDGIVSRASPMYETFEESVSVEQRRAVDRAKQRVFPVTSSSGDVVATSVRLTDRHVLVNGHVIDKVRDATIKGDSLQMLRSVSRDLWVAKCVVASGSEPWVLREPKKGEAAVLVYCVQGDVEVSAVSHVRSFDGVNVFTSLVSDARFGVSGAALVALQDAALLGVYCGQTRDSCACVHFGQVQYTDVVETDHQSEVARLNADTEASESIYFQMKERGLHKVLDAAIHSLVPLYSDSMHVGAAVNIGKELVTTVDPDVHQLSVGTHASPLVFDRIGSLQYTAPAVSAVSAASPAVVRKPNPREKVFIVGRDEHSPYFSAYATVVHVGVGARNFSLSELDDAELPFVGGLVVAQSDCAVVGQYVGLRASMSRGSVNYCASLEAPAAGGSTVSIVDHLAKRFPMLNPTSWPADMVEEMITHSSVHIYSNGEMANAGNLPLAAIGDGAAATILRVSMRAAGVPHAQFAHYLRTYQSNEVETESSIKLGLPAFLKVGNGVTIPDKSKVHADLFEAVLGAAYLNETYDTFVQLCEAVGVVPSSWGAVT